MKILLLLLLASATYAKWDEKWLVCHILTQRGNVAFYTGNDIVYNTRGEPFDTAQVKDAAETAGFDNLIITTRGKKKKTIKLK